MIGCRTLTTTLTPCHSLFHTKSKLRKWGWSLDSGKVQRHNFGVRTLTQLWVETQPTGTGEFDETKYGRYVARCQNNKCKTDGTVVTKLSSVVDATPRGVLISNVDASAHPLIFVHEIQEAQVRW
jgi:hypothetical protein